MVKPKKNNLQVRPAEEDHSSKETTLTFNHRYVGREDEDTNKTGGKNIIR